MTTVHTTGGQTVDLANYPGATVGASAQALAADTYPGASAAFSFKVNGRVVDPNTRPADLGLDDGSTVELVDVSDYVWPATDTPVAPEAPADPAPPEEPPAG